MFPDTEVPLYLSGREDVSSGDNKITFQSWFNLNVPSRQVQVFQNPIFYNVSNSGQRRLILPDYFDNKIGYRFTNSTGGNIPIKFDFTAGSIKSISVEYRSAGWTTLIAPNLENDTTTTIQYPHGATALGNITVESLSGGSWTVAIEIEMSTVAANPVTIGNHWSNCIGVFSNVAQFLQSNTSSVNGQTLLVKFLGQTFQDGGSIAIGQLRPGQSTAATLQPTLMDQIRAFPEPKQFYNGRVDDGAHIVFLKPLHEMYSLSYPGNNRLAAGYSIGCIATPAGQNLDVQFSVNGNISFSTQDPRIIVEQSPIKDDWGMNAVYQALNIIKFAHK